MAKTKRNRPEKVCPHCGSEIDHFRLHKETSVSGEMRESGVDWFDDYEQEENIVECPECDESVEWEIAVKIMRGE